jgi:hypothetical protein
MARFSIETTYKLPIYRLRIFEALSVEEACRQALEDDNWENAKRDYDSSSEPCVTGIWPAGAEYACFSLPIPPAFMEAIIRKTGHCDTLMSLLAEMTSNDPPQGAPFEDWLRRAKEALAEASAIANENQTPLSSGCQDCRQRG